MDVDENVDEKSKTTKGHFRFFLQMKLKISSASRAYQVKSEYYLKLYEKKTEFKAFHKLPTSYCGGEITSKPTKILTIKMSNEISNYILKYTLVCIGKIDI